ncbi:hypothetical protein LDL49_23645 [Nonomuraea sp. NEAU-L178]|nr:hypothetical protein [Nonomuraea aurantiaca]MCA2224225.1 hypothetical protein [Nonomuraea aurantiaca]
MSASQYRSQLERKRKQRIEAEKKAGEYRSKETGKRTAAAKARTAAAKASSTSTTNSKLREAERFEKDAATAGKEAGRWGDKAVGYAKDEAGLQGKLAKAEQAERDAAEQQRQREQQQAQRQRAAESASFQHRISRTESVVQRAIRELRAPKPEKLRVLILGAASQGTCASGASRSVSVALSSLHCTETSSNLMYVPLRRPLIFSTGSPNSAPMLSTSLGIVTTTSSSSKMNAMSTMTG